MEEVGAHGTFHSATFPRSCARTARGLHALRLTVFGRRRAGLRPLRPTIFGVCEIDVGSLVHHCHWIRAAICLSCTSHSMPAIPIVVQNAPTPSDPISSKIDVIDDPLVRGLVIVRTLHDLLIVLKRNEVLDCETYQLDLLPQFSDGFQHVFALSLEFVLQILHLLLRLLVTIPQLFQLGSHLLHLFLRRGVLLFEVELVLLLLLELFLHALLQSLLLFHFHGGFPEVGFLLHGFLHNLASNQHLLLHCLKLLQHLLLLLGLLLSAALLLLEGLE
mmetsp:Transcript_19890/g.46590  ORF Transcript_19890/g.46590 Transcript_19890/m.46590 type:complete len:275 (+) Transcript_19890:239-1063(+)